MCCRFPPSSHAFGFELADHRTYSGHHSSRIWHLVLLSRNIYSCWLARLDCLHTLFVIATFDVRLSGADYSKEMPRRVRPDRMDKTEIRPSNSPVSESINVASGHSRGLKGNADIKTSRLITLFLYMVAELSALQQIINALTGLKGLDAVIVECAVTTIYTCKFF